MKILLDWWMEEGNYSKYCGKNSEGIKKKQFCDILADRMSKEAISQRDGRNVKSKIEHVKRTWKKAHDFATSATGAGIQASDGLTKFEDLVKGKCPFYYDLLDIMQDRASSKPKVTNYDLENEVNIDDDDDDDVVEVHGAAAGMSDSDISGDESNLNSVINSIITDKTGATHTTPIGNRLYR